MKHKKIVILFIVLSLLGWILINNRIGFRCDLFNGTAEKFTLEPGDILVRPNLNWLPGSSKVLSGRNFGHVVIVVKGASESTVEETLKKSQVVEAIIFDQATRRFEFNIEKQIRQTSAWISFGNRFKGIRYRLRTTLTDEQKNEIIRFLQNRVGKGRYSLFATKEHLNKVFSSGLKSKDERIKCNCATLTWYSYFLTSTLDIDFNNGRWIYPNDIIRSETFNKKGARVRF
jgi:hypothetical protein